MCGIAGIFDASAGLDLEGGARRMAAELVHRGPDDEGIWLDASHGLALVHRRLAIIDVSPQGHQPMNSVSGRYVVVYNGEIYKFEEIRAELQAAGCAPAWRGHSDTEVLLAAVEAWGFEATLRRLVGMFDDPACFWRRPGGAGARSLNTPAAIALQAAAASISTPAAGLIVARNFGHCVADPCRTGLLAYGHADRLFKPAGGGGGL